jgi:dihydrofolate reductase
MATPRVRVFLAQSLDGFIAGPSDDLSWLPQPDPAAAPGGDDGDEGGFQAFLGEVGAILMGRRTFDVVTGFEGPWPYGELPMLVATHRALEADVPTAHAVEGSIEAMVSLARAAAKDKDVYVDGGHLVRQALDAGLVDELTITIVPMALGAGVPLFAGVEKRHRLDLQRIRTMSDGLVQLTYEVVRAG